MIHCYVDANKIKYFKRKIIVGEMANSDPFADPLSDQLFEMFRELRDQYPNMPAKLILTRLMVNHGWLTET